MKYKIYTLSCPITFQVRYIGRTKETLNSRLSKHIAERNKHKNHRCHWIAKLYSQGLKPIIELLDETEDKDRYFDLETYWIYQFESWGFNLVNETHGGEGSLGYKHTPESLIKIKEANKKRYSNHVKKVYKRMTKEEQYEYVAQRRAIPVAQYNIHGKFLKKWKSAKEAAISYNTCVSTITNATNSLYTPITLGYLWKKYENEDDIVPILKLHKYKKYESFVPEQ